MRVPRPLRSGPAPVFARARPETVSLREEFAFQQVISMQPSQQRDGAPTGRIKIAVPLDGDRYFSREAIADVQRAGWQPGTPASATVGHLLLSGFERTDLGDSAGLNDGFGSIPLRVPLPQGPDAGLEQLSEDRTTCVIEHEYRMMLQKAELKWTRALAAKIRSGALEGSDEWRSWFAGCVPAADKSE